MPCPLSSQGKSKRVFVGSSGARGVFCKGLADERGNHILMHAKIIIGGICATGKNLDFSSSLMRKLRSSVAKYLLGESRGSRGVYSPKEMGGLSSSTVTLSACRACSGRYACSDSHPVALMKQEITIQTCTQFVDTA